MANQTYKTPEQIRQQGMTALNEALGPVDAARFIRLFDRGSGDYTAEKEEHLSGIGLDEIVAGLMPKGA